MTRTLRTPPKTQQVVDIDPRGKSFVLHTLCATIMINGFLALDQLALNAYMQSQVGWVSKSRPQTPLSERRREGLSS